MNESPRSGPLALVGGGEWTDGCTFDRWLLDEAPGDGTPEVVIVPAGLAYENPSIAIERAQAWFASLGATTRALPVLSRSDGFDAASIEAVSAARFVYLPGTSPMHLRSVLKDSPLYEALLDAWHGGAALAASGAGADVLCDPMVDARGGAFTVGLGAVAGLAVIPRANRWSHDKIQRTVELAPPGLPIVAVPEATALVRDVTGGWSSAGVGECTVHLDGRVVDLSVLS